MSASTGCGHAAGRDYAKEVHLRPANWLSSQELLICIKSSPARVLTILSDSIRAAPGRGENHGNADTRISSTHLRNDGAPRDRTGRGSFAAIQFAARNSVSAM